MKVTRFEPPRIVKIGKILTQSHEELPEARPSPNGAVVRIGSLYELRLVRKGRLRGPFGIMFEGHMTPFHGLQDNQVALVAHDVSESVFIDGYDRDERDRGSLRIEILAAFFLPRRVRDLMARKELDHCINEALHIYEENVVSGVPVP